MKNNQNKIYYNKKQLECMIIAAAVNYIIASRGFGKSEGIDAPFVLRNIHAMPGSTGAILSPTYGKLLRNTLPATFRALERHGYKRNIHYVVGRKPPKILNYRKPLVEPFDWDYTISFFNGSIANLISFDRPMSANSMSLDWIWGPEAKYLDYDKIKNEVNPANRGNKQYFGNCPWHHSQLYSSDMPTSTKGKWMLEKEKEMDPVLIELIKYLYYQIQNLKSKPDKKQWDHTQIASLTRELNMYRKNATLYAEYDVFDNIELLDESFIKNMKRDLPKFIFNTAILNMKPRKIANGFYPALTERLHYYSSYNDHVLLSLDYDTDKASRLKCKKDGDLNPSLPLRIAFDYNAAISSVVTGQVVDNKLNTNNWQFVKTPRKLTELCNDWCDYYNDFPNRDVIYYFDSTAIAETADGNALPFYQIVVNTLEARGWNVTQCYIGGQMKHDKKHLQIDLALKGNPDLLFPMFNQDNCEFLLLAMEQTGIKIGRNGFEKDKDIEKTEDTPDNPDELKTHGTDAWDTLFIGCNFFTVTYGSIPIPTSYK